MNLNMYGGGPTPPPITDDTHDGVQESEYDNLKRQKDKRVKQDEEDWLIMLKSYFTYKN